MVNPENKNKLSGDFSINSRLRSDVVIYNKCSCTKLLAKLTIFIDNLLATKYLIPNEILSNNVLHFIRKNSYLHITIIFTAFTSCIKAAIFRK